jgi:ankyrin repeat protein
MVDSYFAVKLLIEARAEVLTIDDSGSSPLFAACCKGNLEIVKLLLTKTSANLNTRNNQGHTPLSAACCQGHLNVVQFLLNSNAQIIPLKSSHRTHPLVLSASFGHTSIVKSLLMQPIVFEKKVMFYALGAAVENCSLDVIHVLFESGAQLPVQEVFNSVVYLGNCKIIKLFMQNGAKPDAESIEIACDNGHEKAVELILNSQASLCNEIGPKGIPPLVVAATRRNLEVVKLLIKRNASYEKDDNCHHGYICDVGDHKIYGLLYHCTVCPNSYDTCAKCWQEHKITCHRPRRFPRSTERK